MRSSDILNWTERMRKIITDDVSLSGRSMYVAKHCPYGDKYFCDGSPNGTLRNPPQEAKPSCPMFIDGRCKRKLHKEVDRSRINAVSL